MWSVRVLKEELRYKIVYYRFIRKTGKTKTNIKCCYFSRTKRVRTVTDAKYKCRSICYQIHGQFIMVILKTVTTATPMSKNLRLLRMLLKNVL